MFTTADSRAIRALPREGTPSETNTILQNDTFSPFPDPGAPLRNTISRGTTIVLSCTLFSNRFQHDSKTTLASVDTSILAAFSAGEGLEGARVRTAWTAGEAED